MSPAPPAPPQPGLGGLLALHPPRAPFRALLRHRHPLCDAGVDIPDRPRPAALSRLNRNLLRLSIASNAKMRRRHGHVPAPMAAAYSDDYQIGCGEYDLVVVGSGNGACGFLSRYLEEGCREERILVLEEGVDFFEASDIAHQINWTRSFAQADVYKLHQARTPDGRPVISGRACVMGGGGTINYTLIHESNAWLSEHVGQGREYWAGLKGRLNAKFKRDDPRPHMTPVTKSVVERAVGKEFQVSDDQTGWIPNFPDEPTCARLVHPFPTQFNDWGQRTHSGVSLVNWRDPRLTRRTLARVERLHFEQDGGGGLRATGLTVRDTRSGRVGEVRIADGGRVVLAAGSSSPQLLAPQAGELGEGEIGAHVADHVLLPLAPYVTDCRQDPSPRDNYVPVFLTTEYPDAGGALVNLDFFAGNFQELWYFLSHLLLSFLPNFVKRPLAASPTLFNVAKNAIRLVLQALNLVVNLVATFPWLSFLRGRDFRFEYDLIVPIVKFNTTREGYYDLDAEGHRPRITLGFFTDNRDAEIARRAIKDHMELLGSLGAKPPWIIRSLFQLITKIPYKVDEVDRYVKSYGKNNLLSEQHLAGGCLFGKAVDKGEEKGEDTGKVKGSRNVHVADLSTVSMPRVSTQMTAYLIGFHVANKLRESSKGL